MQNRGLLWYYGVDNFAQLKRDDNNSTKTKENSCTCSTPKHISSNSLRLSDKAKAMVGKTYCYPENVESSVEEWQANTGLSILYFFIIL